MDGEASIKYKMYGMRLKWIVYVRIRPIDTSMRQVDGMKELCRRRGRGR